MPLVPAAQQREPLAIEITAEAEDACRPEVLYPQRHDLTASDRRTVHATFPASHTTDRRAAPLRAMDLTSPVADQSLSIETFTLGPIGRSRSDVPRRTSQFY